MSIQETIKGYMQENKISYDELATRVGCTRQNLWNQLNKGNEPNLESIKKIAEALGFVFTLKNGEKEVDAKALFEAVEMEQISYSLAEKILNSVGHSLILNSPEK